MILSLIGKDGIECPAMCPVQCGPGEMTCYGGHDENGCEYGDICVPMKGPMGNDGKECQAYCPVHCSGHEVYCPGGMGSNGCPGPDFCIPHGMACPASYVNVFGWWVSTIMGR